jgi:hypothetical protein
MCHRVHVMLSAEDKQDVKKLSGIMIPVYASILALIAVVAVSGSSPQGELVASTTAHAATR